MTTQYDFTGTPSGVIARIHCSGRAVLNTPAINRGTAFTPRERDALGLTGLLPAQVTTLETQVRLAYAEYSEQLDARDKWAYLSGLRADNELLYYRLLTERLTEILSVLDAPFSDALHVRPRSYSHMPHGVYLSVDHPEDIRMSLLNTGLGPDDVDVLVATDSGNPGVNDLGVGVIDISIGRLAVYTAAAGINPGRTLPVVLDVGTNSLRLLNDDMYCGVRHSRAGREKYDQFIAAYLTAAGELFPGAVLHCTGLTISDDAPVTTRAFSDTQGTAAVVLAAVISGNHAAESRIRDQRIVIYGANPLNSAIADLLQLWMIDGELSPQEASGRVLTLDPQGSAALVDPPVRPTGDEPLAMMAVSGANGTQLAELIDQFRPTILVDSSAAAEACTEAVVRQMTSHSRRPILITPSNTRLPDSFAGDLLTWTDGRALIAVGKRGVVVHQKRRFQVAQVDKALIYPGIGLGVTVAKASRISDRMIIAAARAVAGMSNPQTTGTPLLPPLTNLRQVAATVAIAVATTAAAEGLAQAPVHDPIRQVHEAMWRPEYPRISLDSF